MSQYIADGQALTDIADAIREKTAEESSMTVSEMPNKILSIVSGGGEATPQSISELLTNVEWSNVTSGSGTTDTLIPGKHYIINYFRTSSSSPLPLTGGTILWHYMFNLTVGSTSVKDFLGIVLAESTKITFQGSNNYCWWAQLD